MNDNSRTTLITVLFIPERKKGGVSMSSREAEHFIKWGFDARGRSYTLCHPALDIVVPSAGKEVGRLPLPICPFIHLHVLG